MPSMQDKLDLIQWVEKLPSRESAQGFEQVLAACSTRYGNTQGHLAVVIDKHVELYQRSLRALVRHHRLSLEKHEMPEVDFIREAQEKCLRAVLLRMWTYTAEYYQRWTLPELERELTVDEDAIDNFLKGLNDG